jgi:hypothetical protein
MTQSPHTGQTAPLTTDVGSGITPRHASGANVDGSGSVPSGSPSPNTPTTSTPWGSTSTATSGSANPYASGAPVFTSNPLSAESPTATVPPIQSAPSGLGVPTSNAGRTAPRAARARGPRRARLQLRNVNPWTVLKFSCVLSIALFFVWLIVIGVLFGVLDAAGVIGKINDAYTTIQGADSKPPVTAGVVFGGAAIIGVVNIVLFIALSTVGSIVYNLCADLVGGIEITLSER